MATLRDVAARAGVSVSLVSAVISGRSGTIRMSDDTRAKVQQAAEEIGYRGNHNARSLRTRRSGIVSIVVPNLLNPVLEQVIQGAQQAAVESNGMLMLSDSNWITPGSQLLARVAGTGAVDGFLVRSADRDDELLTELARRDSPYVLLLPPNGEDVCVWVDDHAGIELAARTLLERGHRKIALLGGLEPTAGQPNSRVEGYLAAHDQAGVAVDRGLIQQVGYVPATVANHLDRLLSLPDRATALIADNANLVPVVLSLLSARGLSVPEDFSVIAYHDLPYFQAYHPPITAVAMPLLEVGRLAHQTVIAIAEGEPAQSYVFTGQAKLVERSSVAPPPTRPH